MRPITELRFAPAIPTQGSFVRTGGHPAPNPSEAGGQPTATRETNGYPARTPTSSRVHRPAHLPHDLRSRGHHVLPLFSSTWSESLVLRWRGCYRRRPDQYDSPRLERRQLARDKQQLLELEKRHLAGLRVVEPQCAYFDCRIGDVAPFSSQSAGSKEVGRMDPLITADHTDDIISTSQAPPIPIHTNNNYNDHGWHNSLASFPSVYAYLCAISFPGVYRSSLSLFIICLGF